MSSKLLQLPIMFTAITGLIGFSVVGLAANQHSMLSVAEDAPVSNLIQNALKAKSVIVKSLTSNPGIRAGLAMTSVELTFTGSQTDFYQSFSPEEPLGEEPLFYQTALDLTSNRTWAQARQNVGGGVILDISAIQTPKQTYQLNNHSKWKFPDRSIGALLKTFSYNTVPALVLKDVLGRPGTLSYTGNSNLNGDPVEVVDFVDVNGLRSRLWFHSNASTLIQFQILAPAGLAGEQILQYRYFGAQIHNSVVFPEAVEISTGSPKGRTSMLNLQINAVNAKIDEARFALPEDFTEMTERTFKAEYATKNIIVVRGVGNPLYRAVFIETEKGLIAFDAPISLGLTQKMVEAAKALANNKPVTHVILSHFHTDHIGGYAGYLGDKPVYIGTQDTASVLHDLTSRGPLLFAPPGPGPSPVNIEVFDGSRTIDVGETSLRIVELGPTPHVKQLLAVYDPREKILIASDTYSKDTPWSESMTHFADWLKTAPVEIEQLIGIHFDLITKGELLTIANSN